MLSSQTVELQKALKATGYKYFILCSFSAKQHDNNNTIIS